MIRLAALTLALCAGLVLAACDQPDWMDSMKADPTPAPPFELPGAALPPNLITPDVATIAEELPAPPDWVAAVIGRKLDEAFPAKGECTGNTDRVVAKYLGDPAGLKLVGWGWDPAAKRRIERILLT